MPHRRLRHSLRRGTTQLLARCCPKAHDWFPRRSGRLEEGPYGASCEGFRMPAISNVVASRGRRPKASKEGTRGGMRTEGAAGLYGDLGLRAGPARRRRGGREHGSTALESLSAVLWSAPARSDGGDRGLVRVCARSFARASSLPVEAPGSRQAAFHCRACALVIMTCRSARCVSGRSAGNAVWRRA